MARMIGEGGPVVVVWGWMVESREWMPVALPAARLKLVRAILGLAWDDVTGWSCEDGDMLIGLPDACIVRESGGVSRLAGS